MRIHGILFDKDGVLVDFQRTWGPACASVITDVSSGDLELARRLADAIDFDLTASRFRPESVFIAGPDAETLKALGSVLGSDTDGALGRELIARISEAGQETLAAPPELNDTLAKLADAGKPLGIATNDGEASARGQMKKLGVADRFSFIAGADSGFGAKPAPGMILAYAEHLNTDPERIVMIGDSLHDMRAARAAGAIAVAIGTGPASLESLAPYADFTVSTLADLPSLLTKGRARRTLRRLFSR